MREKETTRSQWKARGLSLAILIAALLSASCLAVNTGQRSDERLVTIPEALTHLSSANQDNRIRKYAVAIEEYTAGCQGQVYELSDVEGGGHLQFWSKFFEDSNSEYFIGGLSARGGGSLFIVRQVEGEEQGCIAWFQRLNVKGGNGHTSESTWGYWDHPSQAAVVNGQANQRFLAITMNCFVEDCGHQDEPSIIFVNIDDPAAPYLYPSRLLSDEWIEPDVLDIAYLDEQWVLGVANAKGPDKKELVNAMWVYTAPDLPGDDPGSLFTAPASAMRYNALFDTSIQFCAYLPDDAESDVYWICSGGDSPSKDSPRNLIWGSRVSATGFPTGRAEDLLNPKRAESNGELDFTMDDELIHSCLFRGGASLTESPRRGLEIHCASWELGEEFTHVRISRY